jgi:hypothetical protein
VKNRHRETQISEFLFRFYRKHTSSFLATIYKAGVTGSAKDIHKARVDAKKVLAFLGLLDVSAGRKAGKPRYSGLFRNLYKASGHLREVQVNRSLLGTHEFAVGDLGPYQQDLLQQERQRTREFLRAIRNFNEDRLADTEPRIRKQLDAITIPRLQKRITRFTGAKLALVSTLMEQDHTEKSLHKVRRHLKELSAILALTRKFGLPCAPDDFIERMNDTEVLIGEWHDRQVLAGSMTDFLVRQEGSEESVLRPVREYLRLLREYDSGQLEMLFETVRAVTGN